MLETKVIVRTNKGREYYGRLNNIDRPTSTVILDWCVNLRGYCFGAYESLKIPQMVIFDVCEISQCDEHMITCIENGIQE